MKRRKFMIQLCITSAFNAVPCCCAQLMYGGVALSQQGQNFTQPCPASAFLDPTFRCVCVCQICYHYLNLSSPSSNNRT